jgi:hypothetical protein
VCACQRAMHVDNVGFLLRKELLPAPFAPMRSVRVPALIFMQRSFSTNGLPVSHLCTPNQAVCE